MQLFWTVSVTKTFKIKLNFLNEVPVAFRTCLGCNRGETLS